MMMIMVQMALLGFLILGGVLSLFYIVRSAGNGRGFGYGRPLPDFESHFRGRLARQKGSARH